MFGCDIANGAPGERFCSLGWRRVGCKRSPGPEAFAVLVVVSEATDFIAVVFAFAFFFLRFPPKNRMSSPKTVKLHPPQSVTNAN
jgi:hypothetical protein